MLKQLKRTRAGMFIISWIAALVIALLLASVRWRRHQPEKLDAILADHKGFILVFWHERLLSMVFLSRDDKQEMMMMRNVFTGQNTMNSH